MNLINDPWIDVIRASSKRLTICPAQITDGIDEDPIVDIESPRPDFRAALYQFLIGLLQTTCDECKTDGDWRDLLDEPPTPDELAGWFAPVADAFELFGDGRRFMQDASVAGDGNKPVEYLIIDAPAENTNQKNRDHFVKRDGIVGLSPESAAAALFCAQTNSPAGGPGFRTGIRGGGPLTTLVLASNREGRSVWLWENLWLNVLPRPEYLRHCGNVERSQLSDRFPWLSDLRISDSSNNATFPEHAHPDQIYWSLPRRIWLHADQSASEKCSVTGRSTETVVAGFDTKKYGVNYEGSWIHPLSPYRKSNDGLWLPLHPERGGIGYRHWGALALGTFEDTSPAKLVRKLGQRNLRNVQYRLWANGFEMNKAKASCWYESIFPLYCIPQDHLEAFEATVEELIQGATQASQYLRRAIKTAWFREGATVSGDLSFIVQAFWEDTESEFFDQLHCMATSAATDPGLSLQDRQAAKNTWHGCLVKAVLRLFDQWAAGAGVEHADPRRISQAHNGLLKSLYGPKLKHQVLKLPEENKHAA